MKELLIATKNSGKFREIMETLRDLPFKFVFLKDLDLDDGDFVEDGESFEENALKKAKYYHEKTGMLSLGEDSGIIVDALAGELGVKTRRWGAGEKADDKVWIEYFLQRMSSESNKNAEFVCAACVFGKDVCGSFLGETKGILTETLQAPILEGIPLSSCFVPKGLDRVYASLSVDEKNLLSHRGKAMSEVRSFLTAMSSPLPSES